MKAIATVAILAVAVGPIAIARLWWGVWGVHRFRSRSVEYISHVKIGGTSRCACASCVEFRRYMGWRAS